MPSHAPVAVKEAVLPFKRFRTREGLVVDSLLGPEMRSTGEVMGIDEDFGTAFAKGMLAAGSGLPREGRIFVSVANRDKRAMIFPVKRLADLGFTIVATTGTADVLRRNGIASEVVHKHSERERGRLEHRRPHPGRRDRDGGQHPERPERARRRLRDPRRDHVDGPADRHHGPGARRGGAGHRGAAGTASSRVQVAAGARPRPRPLRRHGVRR